MLTVEKITENFKIYIVGIYVKYLCNIYTYIYILGYLEVLLLLLVYFLVVSFLFILIILYQESERIYSIRKF